MTLPNHTRAEEAEGHGSRGYMTRLPEAAVGGCLISGRRIAQPRAVDGQRASAAREQGSLAPTCEPVRRVNEGSATA